MDVTEQYLADLEALDRAATPGPWFAGGEPWGTHGLVYARAEDPHAGIAVADCDDVQAMEEENDRLSENNSIADAAFIAEARRAVPALVAAVRELQAAAVDPEYYHLAQRVVEAAFHLVLSQNPSESASALDRLKHGVAALHAWADRAVAERRASGE